MDGEYAELHLAVDRYLQGSLDERELTALEERLVWDQALIDELDLAERLREGLRAHVADHLRPPALREGDRQPGMWRFWSVPRYAAAASFVLGVGLTAMVLLQFQPPAGNQAPWTMPTEIVPLVAVRGAAVPAVILDERSWTVLLVDVPGAYETFRVTVRPDRDGAQPIWQQGDLLPTYPDAIAVGMPASLLPPGNYVLELEGADTAASGRSWERIQNLPFQTEFTELR